MGPIVRSVIEAQRFAELAKRPAYADLWYATIQSGAVYRALRRNVALERVEAQRVFLRFAFTRAFALEIALPELPEVLPRSGPGYLSHPYRKGPATPQIERRGVGASVTPPLMLMGEHSPC